jgi:hypothetical protein
MILGDKATRLGTSEGLRCSGAIGISFSDRFNRTFLGVRRLCVNELGRARRMHRGRPGQIGRFLRPLDSLAGRRQGRL